MKESNDRYESVYLFCTCKWMERATQHKSEAVDRRKATELSRSMQPIFLNLCFYITKYL